jgi:NAD-reducing hydrogenase large subunit
MDRAPVMTETIRLDQVVTGVGARISVEVDSNGGVTGAWFVLDDLPRVEGLLLGRPVAAVPTLVEHLCGICPVAHHLAGVRALESLTGAEPITGTAQAVRRLLHYGDVLQTHASHGVDVDIDRSYALQSFARRVVTAAAGPGHFPQCAVPGGVLAPVTTADRDALADDAGLAVQAAEELVAQVHAGGGLTRSHEWAGYDVALTDEQGQLDLYGSQLRAVSAKDARPQKPVLIAGADEWTTIVAEARTGMTASRPFLRLFGAEVGGYRVGPVAQLRIGELTTRQAESARERWLDAGGGAKWARAIVALHAAEIVSDLLRRPELTAGPLLSATGTSARGSQPSPDGVGTGWVDGARGLLVHTYRTGHDGKLVDACITTPTAQNERWLAALLTATAKAHPLPAGLSTSLPPPKLVEAMEAAVREADPCLPCTSLPVGRMGLAINVVTPEAI